MLRSAHTGGGPNFCHSLPPESPLGCEKVRRVESVIRDGGKLTAVKSNLQHQCTSRVRHFPAQLEPRRILHVSQQLSILPTSLHTMALFPANHALSIKRLNFSFFPPRFTMPFCTIAHVPLPLPCKQQFIQITPPGETSSRELRPQYGGYEFSCLLFFFL